MRYKKHVASVCLGMVMIFFTIVYGQAAEEQNKALMKKSYEEAINQGKMELIDDLLADGGKVWAYITITETHSDPFMEMEPTGKKINTTTVDIVRRINSIKSVI